MERAPGPRPHPLESLVLAIMAADPAQDVTKLAALLAGATHIRSNPKLPKFGISGDRAYRLVALDFKMFDAARAWSPD